jgi:pectin methylesterase-like acyl-CoA thioesterase
MQSFRDFSGLSAALMVVLSSGTGCTAAPNPATSNIPVPNTPMVVTTPPRISGEAAKTVTVIADDSGDFKTVQAAVDAAPTRTTQRLVIRIKPGTYKEKIRIPRDKGPITFLGENAEKTILTFDDAASTVRDGKAVGTGGSYSLQVQAKDFVAENITIENSAGRTAGQAVALSVEGDRAAFRKCRILGWQDTLYAGSGRQYYEDCTIAGSVDYIFGGAPAWFERCVLHSRGNGKVTAASTPQEQPYGYVFSHCTLTTDPGVKAGLGRTWRASAAVAFLHTKMSDAVDPLAWDDWGNPENQKTARYAEYNSQTLDGQPLDVSGRAPWAKQLTAQESAQYSISNVLGGTDGKKPFGQKSLIVTRPANPITAPPGTLPAHNVTIYGTNARLENDGANIGFWSDTDTSFEWSSNVQPGTYKLALTYGLDGAQAGSELAVSVGDKSFKLTPPATGGWGDYKTVEVGEVEIKVPNTPISVSALSQKGDFILNLREVTLRKAN